MSANDVCKDSSRVSPQHGLQESARASSRSIRKILDTGLPFVGIVLIFSTLLLVQELSKQIALVAIGILIIEVGVWKLAQKLLPSERQYTALREEVDRFITLVRRLNRAALVLKENPAPEHVAAFEEIRGAMQQTLDQITEVTGKTDAEIANAKANLVSPGVVDTW